MDNNNYLNFRSVIFLLSMIIFLAANSPIGFVVLTGMAIAAYIVWQIFRKTNVSNKNKVARTAMRKEALKNAAIYLSPYTNIWNNLKLSNKYCSLKTFAKW